ncbi:hypothetical protein [Deinococcus sp.]|uniref:hypothetical protein n=1 Tax=Deinococcus sp. TaxID=47478 RepID=UPI0025DF3AFF|nr:hypothetical protein [Deinococcus sp.]
MQLNAKLFAAALALPLLLAACGSASTSSGSVVFNSLQTEYKDQTGNFVACDNTTLQGGGTTKITSVSVKYSASGTVNSLDIGLRGSTTSDKDANYNVNVPGTSLTDLGGGNFKTVFTADSSVNLLPNSLQPLKITVNPNPNVVIKNVTTSGDVGSFYTRLAINTPTGSAETTSLIVAPRVKVYTSCTVTSTTAEQL